MDPVRRINTTMPESLLNKVDLYSKLNLEDRATAIRQLVAEGLHVKLQQIVLERYRKGKLTIREGAELLGISYLEMDETLRENRVPLFDDISLLLERRSKRPTRLPPESARRRRTPTKPARGPAAE